MCGLLQKFRRFCLASVALGLVADLAATGFGTKGAGEPSNIDEFASLLKQDARGPEPMIRYGPSVGGSAGHLALSNPNPADGSETVYWASFCVDLPQESAVTR